MGSNIRELSRRRALALAAGLTTTVLPIWGTALAVAPYPGEAKNQKRKGEAQPSATESLMAQHGVLLRILNVYADLAHRLQAGAADIDTIALIAGEGAPLAKALTSMTRMFRAHLALEDTVVFPAWKAMQSKARLEEMAGRFEDIGRERFGRDCLDHGVARIAKIEQALGLADIAALTAAPPRAV